MASAIVLRDVHCALLRAIEGKDLGKPDQAVPQAKLMSPDSTAALFWTARVAKAILAAPLPSVDEAGQVSLGSGDGSFHLFSLAQGQ